MTDLESRLERLFRRRFGDGGELRTAFAPGRVNLIGEHLDYNGLTVLPMALARGVRVVVRARDDERVRLVNLEPRHRPVEFALGAAPAGAPRAGDWSDLVRAAGRGLASRHGALRGFDGAVGSDLPSAAGLSSSTALVVAVARALIAVNRLAVERDELIATLARAERAVGAPGGVMDQAACVAGLPRVALETRCEPLALTPIALPARWRFVVAHSGVEADKAGAAEAACRDRIEACGRVLAALRAACVPGSTSFAELVASHSPGELAELARHLPSAELRRRYAHVVGEAGRVTEAVAALRRDDPAEFGRLMNASHRSLRDDFEVSHPRLDQLVELCAAHSALGARLTGAGFGGCAVALCEGSAAPLLAALGRRVDAATGRTRNGNRRLFEA